MFLLMYIYSFEILAFKLGAGDTLQVFFIFMFSSIPPGLLSWARSFSKC